jgi:metal-responsive CopG/Arc/MetJ family transcriptional regulator
MGRATITISMDEKVLAEVDRWVSKESFPTRSTAIESAVQEQIAKLRRSRLTLACAGLDRVEEQAMAEEGYVPDLDRRA